MPATLAELKAVRQELIDKTPLLFQAEIYNFWGQLEKNTPNLKSPNTFIDARILFIKEAIKAWEGGIPSRKHILDLFNTPNSLNDAEFLNKTLDSLTNLKSSGTLADYARYTQRRGAMPEIYGDFNEEIKTLEAEKTQLATDKKTAEDAKTTAEASLKKYTDNLGTETAEELKTKVDKLTNWESIFWTKNLEGVKAWWTQIKKEWDVDFENPYDIFTYENLKKVKTDLDKLKSWTDIFGKEAKPTEINNQLTSSKGGGDKFTNLNTKWEEVFAGEFELTPEGISKLADAQKQARLNEGYKNQLLTIKLTDLESKLRKFAIEVYLDKDNIDQQFGNLTQVIKENVTFDNIESAEKTLKTIILILAPYNAQAKSLTKHKLLPIQKKYSLINGEVLKLNNKLFDKYQSTIEKYPESKTLIDKLAT